MTADGVLGLDGQAAIFNALRLSRHSYPAWCSKGFSVRGLKARKSRVLRVTTIRLWTAAVAAHAAEFRDDVGVEEIHRRSGESSGPAAVSMAARGNVQVASRFLGQGEFFQRGPGCSLEVLPVRHRHQDGGLGATPGDELGAFLQADFQ
jgi:hypothetical protein